ncbi:mtDNA inheritance, partitioning of the mitochondrial organelle, partial [Blyttiomyces sp. JEL0837]
MDERFRFFLEECDTPQGIQIFADVGDGFSGLVSSLVQDLRDSVEKLPIVVFGIADDTFSPGVKSDPCRLNSLMALSSIASAASLYLPIYSPPKELPPSFVDFSTKYRWTASMALAADTIIAPTRHGVHLGSVFESVSSNGPVVSLASSLPTTDVRADVADCLGKDLNTLEDINWMYDHTLRVAYDEVEHGDQVSVVRGWNSKN